MNRRVVGLLSIVSFTATGCIVPEDARPGVSLGGTFATKFVHRGMIQSENGVFQPRLAVSLPTITDDTVTLVARGNMDLNDDNGDAWFPRGHGGRFSEIDFVGTWTHRLTEDVTVQAGLFNYNLPNGLEFATDGQGGPGEERGGTTEMFVRVSANVLEATPYVSWHYDFDEVRAAYYRVGVTETFQINDDWGIVLDGSLGYATSGQSNWLYDLDESGLADLRGKAEVVWRYDPRTTITGGVHGSAMMNSTLDRWFVDVGVPDDDPIWFSLGVNWTF
ncbi:MAG: hypothetical protein KAI24_12225 [Planctomycetes bacterium]|nr:hypothetical protein [Planctomycetota bacterium]